MRLVFVQENKLHPCSRGMRSKWIIGLEDATRLLASSADEARGGSMLGFRHLSLSMAEKAILGFLFVACLPGILAGCSPQVAQGGEGDDGASLNFQIEWTSESDCSICHESEGMSFSEAACLASLHESASCVDCHNEGLLSEVHSDVWAADEAPTALQSTSVEDDQCLQCHDHDSREELAKKTSSFRGLVDTNGTVVNPHDIPGEEGHTDIKCMSCHKIHTSDSETLSDTRALCQSCHHSNVFECYTCHA